MIYARDKVRWGVWLGPRRGSLYLACKSQGFIRRVDNVTSTTEMAMGVAVINSLSDPRAVHILYNAASPLLLISDYSVGVFVVRMKDVASFPGRSASASESESAPTAAIQRAMLWSALQCTSGSRFQVSESEALIVIGCPSGLLAAVIGAEGVVPVFGQYAWMTQIVGQEGCGIGSPLKFTMHQESGTILAACSRTGVQSIVGGQSLTTLLPLSSCAKAGDVWREEVSQGGRVFVLCQSSSSVQVLSGMTFTPVVSHQDCTEPMDAIIVSSESSNRILVGCLSRRASVIDVTPGTQDVMPVLSTSWCPEADSLSYDHAGGVVVACIDPASGDVSVVNQRLDSGGTDPPRTVLPPQVSGCFRLQFALWDELSQSTFVICTARLVRVWNATGDYQVVLTVGDQDFIAEMKLVEPEGVYLVVTGFGQILAYDSRLDPGDIGAVREVLPGEAVGPTVVADASVALDLHRHGMFIASNGGLRLYALRAYNATASSTGQNISWPWMVDSSVPPLTLLPSDSSTCSLWQQIEFDNTTNTLYAACIQGDMQGVMMWRLFSFTGNLTSLLLSPPPPTQLLDANGCKGPHLRQDQSSGMMLISCHNGDSFGAVLMLADQFRCQAGFEWSGGSCTPCIPNFFRSPIDSNVHRFPWHCTACDPGSVTKSIGSARCALCDPGSYDNGANECEQCAPGTAQLRPGSTSCHQCLPGTATSEQGQEKCEECVAGTYTAVNKSTTCQPCLPGQAQNLTGQTGCHVCDVGKANAEVGAAMCEPCEIGKYMAHTEAAACALCLPGRYTNLTHATDCIDASPGFAVHTAGASEQNPCMRGTEAPEEGSFVCTPCALGWFSNHSATPKCSPCEVGRYAPILSSTACKLCDRGTYAANNASSTCTPCGRGSASDADGLTKECPPCPAGRYASVLGATTCSPCYGSTFAPDAGSATCAACVPPAVVDANHTTCTRVICPAQTQYSTATAQCETCPLGQYSPEGGVCSVCPIHSYTPHAGSGCISCQQPGMRGLQCSGGLASVSVGWWASLQPPDSNGLQLYGTTPCPEGFCPGSTLQIAPDANSTSDPTPTPSPLSIKYCISPRLNSADNIMCGQCEDGYIPWGDGCSHCPGVNAPLLTGGIFLSFCLVLFLLRSSGGKSAGAVGIVVFFVQTAALEIGPVIGFLQWLTAVNFDSTSTPNCIAPLTVPQQALATLAIPIILMAELALIAAVHFAVHRRYKRLVPLPDHDGEQQGGWESRGVNGNEAGDRQVPAAPSTTFPRSLPLSLSDPGAFTSSSTRARARARLDLVVREMTRSFHPHRYLAAGISILLFTYTSVCVTCMKYLHCVHVDSDVRVLFANPSVHCDNAEYQQALIGVVMALIIYVAAFPIVLFIGLFRLVQQQKKKMKPVARVGGAASIAQPVENHKEGAASSSTVDTFALGPPPSSKVRMNHKSSALLSESDIDAHSMSSNYVPMPDSALPSSNSETSLASSSPSAYFSILTPIHTMYSLRAWYWGIWVLVRRLVLVLISVLLAQVSDSSSRFMAFTFVHFVSLLMHLVAQPYTQLGLNRLETGSYALLVSISLLLTGEQPPYDVLTQIFLLLLIVPPAGAMVLFVLKQQYQELMEKVRKRRQEATEQSIGRELAVNVKHESDSIDQHENVPMTYSRRTSFESAGMGSRRRVTSEDGSSNMNWQSLAM